MFFLLSKLLNFVIAPLTWIIVCFSWAMITKIEKRKKKLLVISFSLLLLFSNSFILDEFNRLWEIPTKSYNELKKYDYAIVLGGILSHDPTLKRIQFGESSDRLWQALELYKRGYVKKIFFVSGSGSILFPESKEALFVKQYLTDLGIPAEDVLYESESRNTRENAINAKEILRQNRLLSDSTNLLLITSGFHMRRSIGCFNKVGLKVTPYSTDRRSGPRKFVFDFVFIPNSEALEGWKLLIHEIVGYITYKIAGYA